MMNLTRLLLVLKANYRFIAIFVSVFVSIVIAACVFMPKTYKGAAVLVLNYKGFDPITGLTLPAQLMPGYIATQVDIIKSHNVAMKVVEDLKLADDPSLKQDFIKETDGEGNINDWIADLLIKKLDVVPGRESSVLHVNFKAPNAKRAAAIANSFASAYQKTSIQLKVEPSQKASIYFNEQTKILRKNIEEAQNRLSDYQKRNGIVNVDNRLDIESAKLSELSSQLVAIQGQVTEANSRMHEAKNSANKSPDVLASPVVQNLKISIAIAEAKFADLAQKLEKNHPQYQAAKAEVDKLHSSLDEQIRLASSGIFGTAQILQRREVEISNALNIQRMKIFELNRARDELRALTSEAESTQRAFESASQRFNAANIDGQSNQSSDIAVLNQAIEPIAPTSPKILLSVAFAVFLSSILSTSFVILMELKTPILRCKEDLKDLVGVPQLGTIMYPRTYVFSIHEAE